MLYLYGMENVIYINDTDFYHIIPGFDMNEVIRLIERFNKNERKLLKITQNHQYAYENASRCMREDQSRYISEYISAFLNLL